MRLRWWLLTSLVLGVAPAARAQTDARNPVPTAVPSERPRLHSLLFTERPGGSVEPPGSPRYLAIKDGTARGTRLLMGWMLPRLAKEERLDARKLAAELGALLTERGARSAAKFGSTVTLFEGAHPAVLEIELTSSIPGMGQTLELGVLAAIGSLGVAKSNDPSPDAPTPGPTEASPIEQLVRRFLSPHARAVVETHPPAPPSPVRSAKPRRHVIEPGDTLSEIALANGIDLGALTRLNGLDAKRPIQPGAELRLDDKSAPRPKLYVVKVGDSLAKVARRFGVSEKALVEANRLDARRLHTGQKLVLPR